MSDSKRKKAEKALLESMPVYRSRARSLQAALETGGPLNLDEFFMHYDGEAPLEAALAHFDGCLTVLDLGCGYGSSLLWLARHSEELRALAGVDLLEENVALARALLRRTLPDDYRVSFLAHDIASLSREALADGCGLDEVDAVLSLNVGVHLGERERAAMWRFVGEVLTARGRVYVEDFYRLRDTDEEEDRLLEQQVACTYLPRIDAYVDAMEQGIEGATIVPEDISTEYAAFAVQRHDSYTGEDERRREFYRAMSTLIGGGAVGGLRIKLSREP